MPITELKDLDPSKVKQAIAKFGQERVNATLRERGLLRPSDIMPKVDTGPKKFTKEEIEARFNTPIAGTSSGFQTSPKLGEDLERAKGFKPGQIGIPGVNIFKSTPPTEGAVTEGAPTDLITGAEPTELEKRLGAQVDITKAEQSQLERQRQDILSRFEGKVTLEELENLNKFEIQDKIKELQLREDEEAEVTKPFEEEMAFQERSQERRLSLFDSKVNSLRSDFDSRIAESREIAAQNDINAQKVAALTGTSFSSAGLSGLDALHRRGVNLINRLSAARSSALTSSGIQREQAVDDFSRAYNALEEKQTNALERAKTSFLAAALEIDADIGITTQEGLDNLIKIKDDFLDREQEIRESTLDQMNTELDIKTKEFDLIDSLETREETRIESFSELENLANVNTSDIIQFSKRFGERANEVAQNLVNRQISNIATGINTALEEFGVRGFGFDKDVQDRITKGILEEGKTPNEVMTEIVGELLADPKKLEELKEAGLTEEEKVTREETEIKRKKALGIDTDIVVTPTGVFATLPYTNEFGTTKSLKIDSVGQIDLQTALTGLGNTVIVGDTHRTTEEQQTLFDAFKAGTGGLAARPGESKHETGLAIDIYSGEDAAGKLLPLKSAQVKIMNDNGWFQTAGEGDKGHFEYLGTLDVEGFDSQDTPLYKSFLGKGLTSTEQKAIPNFEEFKLKAQNYGDFLTKQGTPQIRKLIDLATELRDSPIGRASRIVSGSETVQALSPVLADYQATFNAFISNQALDHLVTLKQGGATFGALSDRELTFIRDAATKLNSKLSDKAYKTELTRIIDLLEKGLEGTDEGGDRIEAAKEAARKSRKVTTESDSTSKLNFLNN